MAEPAGAALNRSFAASLLLNAAAAGTKLGPMYGDISSPADFSAWAEMDWRAYAGLEPAYITSFEESTPRGYLSALPTLEAPPGLGLAGTEDSPPASKLKSNFSSFSTRAGFSSASSSSSVEDEPLSVELPHWKLTF
eukprot:CAMPEP_0114645376 /NCGR_PEP_ID=MMETSP0191-20121206/4520_1 /TAXON_ID=126664 /ORGANISM="Sorites sp." /LENGTH=136 /DNA_ID=CAMNT_0001858005 /DNA_START=9 /DNA_END=419 /DNA_ORIENTATION=-